MIMAQNELQEMISRYQKELLQYARSAKKQNPSSQPATQPQQSTQPQQQRSLQPPVQPFDEMNSGNFTDEIYGYPTDVFDEIQSKEIAERQFNEFDGDLLSDEEMSGYFSEYPEDMIDTAENSPYADLHETMSSHTHEQGDNVNQSSATDSKFVGYLEVTARTGDGAKPIEAALVIVSSTDEKGERLEFTALTDSSGVARLFNLPASNPENTESPDMPDRFILYNVSISKPGYFDMVSTGVPLIGGITSRQDFRMIPLPEGISGDTIEFDNTEPQDLN